ncbi:MAG: hypothetical protein LUE93_08015 [Bacteroides sp.]|nr:hypothetical protein [Bacteroides sp.]
MHKILVEFDWSMVTEPDDNEILEILITDLDDFSREIFTNHNGTEVDLESHIFEFVGFEEAPNVTIDRCILTVQQDASGNYYGPGYFVAGAVEDFIVDREGVQIVTIPMCQQVRPLIIRAIISGAGVGNLSRIAGEISGIAMSRSIHDGFPPIDGEDLHPAFIAASVAYSLESTDEVTFSDRKNLLGTDGGASQFLNLTAIFNDGAQKTFNFDVTDAMFGFHTVNVTEPWVLEFRLSVGIGGGNDMEITIEDWKSGSESELEFK